MIKRRLNVMYLITSLDYGGAEVQVMNLARKMKKNYMVTIVSLIPVNEKFINNYNQDNLSIQSLNMVRGRVSLSALLRAKRIIRLHKIDILHCHMVHANIFGRTMKLVFPRLRVISTAHNLNEGGRVLMSMYKLTNHFSNLNTNVSRRATKRYIAEKIFPASNTLHIPNGHEAIAKSDTQSLQREIKKKMGVNASTFIWLAVGRYEIQKDYNNMVLACKYVDSKYTHKEYRILIAGEGYLKESINQLIEIEGLNEKFMILGNRTDIPNLMVAADAFLMSSAWEGLPLVLIEACSAGLPIVSTRVGGVDEIVFNGINGFTCGPSDPVALGDMMIKMMSSSEKCIKQFKNASYETYKTKFMLKEIVDKWDQIYQDL